MSVKTRIESYSAGKTLCKNNFSKKRKKMRSPKHSVANFPDREEEHRSGEQF